MKKIGKEKNGNGRQTILRNYFHDFDNINMLIKSKLFRVNFRNL